MSPPDGPPDGAPGIGMWLPDPERRLGDPSYPSPWTTDGPLEALRDEEEAIVVSLAPDVALTPIGEAEPVHVPYPIVDFCSDDEHYTPSVRFTGQRAMVMRSHTTCVHGAEAGTGGGAVAGACGGICEPIEHAPAVRAEGSHVIRHLDRFWMDDRNTQGEAYFVRDTATYDPPPDDDPLPGSLRLIEGGGGEKTLQGDAGADRLMNAALSQPAPSPNPARPSSPRPSPSPPRPPGQVIRPDVPQWKRPPPQQPKPPSVGTRLGRLGRWGARIGGVVAGILWPSPLGDGTLPNWSWDLDSEDRHRRRTAEEAQRLYDQNPALRPDLEEWFFEEMEGIPPQAKTKEEQDDLKLQVVPVPGNARVSDEGSQRRCIVGPYEDVKPICNGEAHHIVPDMVYRLGTRPETVGAMRSTKDRIPNAPTLMQGMSICLLPSQHGRGAGGLHGQLNERLKALPTPVSGTAPMDAILEESVAVIINIPDLPSECKELAETMTTAQVLLTVGDTAPGRTVEKPLPSGEAEVVLRRGYY